MKKDPYKTIELRDMNLMETEAWNTPRFPEPISQIIRISEGTREQVGEHLLDIVVITQTNERKDTMLQCRVAVWNATEGLQVLHSRMDMEETVRIRVPNNPNRVIEIELPSGHFRARIKENLEARRALEDGGSTFAPNVVIVDPLPEGTSTIIEAHQLSKTTAGVARNLLDTLSRTEDRPPSPPLLSLQQQAPEK